ncbi:MAG: aminopeptidase P family protein [Muribaculaceae bacterium]|nr:aminopeptidase P family protein [Muribaculaceae bacterium]
MKDKTIIRDRIALLRSSLLSSGLDALIVPQADPHGSEYIARRWQARRWLSGFTGSAGDLVVTLADAALWADSRYWLQAGQQLEDTGIGVVEEGKPDAPSIVDWLAAHLPQGAKVGYDSALISVDKAKSFGEKLSARGLELVLVDDPLGDVWKERPALPQSPVLIHPECYAGESVDSKIASVRRYAADHGASAVLLVDLAQIAWTLNLRGTDINCNPVVISYLFVDNRCAVWFVDPAKLTPEVDEYLREHFIDVLPYDAVADFLDGLAESVLVNSAQVPAKLASHISSCVESNDFFLAVLKACRNKDQIEGTRTAMLQDGVAMVNAFFELDRRMAAGERVTEIGVAELLEAERSKQPGYLCLSFESIVGYAEHGAIVHYTATAESDVVLSPDNLLLVDSGATYLCGTTDITRTFSLGNPTVEQKTDFTLVLKGMIDLARAVFPVGTRGAQLDVLARAEMWRHGAAYLHGTGHGVGHCLNVHEGPQSIRMQENPVELRPGMLTSDEPGIYRAGKYGIRCENLILCVPAFTTDMGEFLKFETMTLYPFDTTLVEASMLDRAEIEWFNGYQTRVYELLAPLLDSDEKRVWLENKCKTLDI